MTIVPKVNVPVAKPAGAPATLPSPPPGRQPTTIIGSGDTMRSALSGIFQGTPGRMRLLGLLGVLAALLLGGISANAILASEAAAERAANNTEQVLRMQSIHVDLLRADALATNAFLVGGLETPKTRNTYDEAMASVVRNIAAGSADQPADAKALGVLAEHVQDYAALVEQARSNNRLGLPVGARYLTEASSLLRASAIPVVSQVVSTNEARAQAEFDRSDSRLQLLIGVAALAVLVSIAVWLAKRTHRYLNRPLTLGVVLLLAGLVVAAMTIGGIRSTTSAVAAGDYGQAVNLAKIRTAANDARANESLTLIQRGSGSRYQTAWVANDKTVDQTLTQVSQTAPLTQAWSAYTTAHAEIRKLDDGGSWEQAVALATSPRAGSPTDTFTMFDEKVTKQRDAASTSTIARLGALGGGNTLWAVVIAIASLAAAWLVIRGIGQRIQEYR